MEPVVMTAKTEEEAIEKALRILRAKREDVSVEVADKGSKGFFGLGQRLAKVVVTYKDDPSSAAKKFISDVTTAMGLSIEIETTLTDRALKIDLKGKNIGILIGKHGQTLDSLQYLTNLAVNKKKETYISVIIDTENYREKRKETLESLARNMAKKVRQSKRAVRLEPMSPSERKVIHAALQGERGINTFSEGVEPFRNVVISFKRENAGGGKGEAKGSGGESGSLEKQGKRPPRSNQRRKPQQDNYKKFIDMDGNKDSE